MTATAGLPLWLQVIIAILVALAAFGGLAGGVYAARSARQANREQRADQLSADDHVRAEVWNAGYRTAAEEHLQYDADRVADIRELRASINRLEDAAGVEKTTFADIPKAPPLFPKLESTK